jgi:hypothetical protein
MKRKYYVTLTGSKNNSGDHLIKYKAYKLLAEFRDDRDVIDMNGWELIDEDKLKIINGSEALLLLGGPALIKKMIPKVYNIDAKKVDVPIISFGIGWHSLSTKLETDAYKLSNKSIETLQQINRSGYLCSVRDTPSQVILQKYGVDNVWVTGCPALFDIEKLGISIEPYRKEEIRRVGFSLGVAFKQSEAMESQMKDALITIKDTFSDKTKVVIAFHHSLGESYQNSHGFSSQLSKRQVRFVHWLESNDFEYADISGSHNKLINFYKSVDLHVGYRVHAHIYMVSKNKPSILISEDGRGAGLRKTINGPILDGVLSVNTNVATKLLIKARIQFEQYTVSPNLVTELKELLKNEQYFNRTRTETRQQIDELWPIMNQFLQSLP